MEDLSDTWEFSFNFGVSAGCETYCNILFVEVISYYCFIIERKSWRLL